ncbi:MAG TPA: ABC transporter ATP-binding protein [Anaerolineae bacterium]|nr:ABC transporter ATP-binding protein [Anaerolineae bacterium]HQK13178.1 ABC transporter ATP-binding protein [Anaerolineae bacterium]
MTDIAIRVENLGKLYRIGAKEHRPATLWQAARQLAASPFEYLRRITRPPTEAETLWALKDVSFEVKRGEVVGVIGRNGAGKSTLLKILSRITEPTSGRAEIHGRVGSLLEVGTGFHPELTGRENIYLNGAILGMKRAEIDRKFDEIVAFAEIEKFLDTPVKRYSSGMYVRLAFAVAAHLEPEILLVDEVLAVGDAAFQKKCLGKMGDVAKEGRTVLFVSHNMAAVRSLCSRSVLLDRGQVIVNGSTEMVVTRYLMSTATDLLASVDTSHLPRPSNITNSALRITRVSIVNGTEQAIVFCNEPFELTLEFVVSEPISEVVFGWSVHSNDNVRLFECRSIDRIGVIPQLAPGQYLIRTSLPSNPLNPGLYTLYVGARCATKGLDYLPSVMSFQVERADRQESLWLEARSGALSLDSEWTTPMSNCVNEEQKV